MNSQNPIDQHEFVSIIIPFKDNANDVMEISAKLCDQTYPKHKFEIIFVDNGSVSKPDMKQIQNCKAKIIFENQHRNSPYSARNRGIEAAKGEILAFIDANSIPEPDWLEKGVCCLLNNESDLIAGDVKFSFGNKATPAMIADSLTSIRMKQAVENRGVAYTANLFVYKRVFDQTGLFEEGVRSGGDVRFTKIATDMGFTLRFCQDAVVFKMARNWKELYKKKARTGRGYFYTWKNESNRNVWFYNFFRSLKPPPMPNENIQSLKVNRLMIWAHLYLTGILEQCSFVIEYLRYTLSQQRDIDRRVELEKDK